MADPQAKTMITHHDAAASEPQVPAPRVHLLSLARAARGRQCHLSLFGIGRSKRSCCLSHQQVATVHCGRTARHLIFTTGPSASQSAQSASISHVTEVSRQRATSFFYQSTTALTCFFATPRYLHINHEILKSNHHILRCSTFARALPATSARTGPDTNCALLRSSAAM